ncbi:p21-activated protein kinase-interacting protein 1-like [Euwallacea fornicatus]|uniref:p21-activated protein kinase-interacting protein 1-like n=1 Tax=Euwallacea fornicatus TaxID=995702 RepID=UPI00338E397A
MSAPPNFEIIAGTYEEYLLGYVYTSKDKSLKQSFASHDHSGSIRCLASSDNYLASGATDDRIVVYDLKARKEHCMLTQHNSTITAVAFTSNHSHVMSASQDGALSLVRVGNWQQEKLWEKAHKEGAVIDIALHSSGKLALTLGTDGTIHTWNLVKGRVAYVINLKTKCRDFKSVEKLLFAPDDSQFLIYGGKFTEIWSIKVGGALKVIEHEQRVTCCVWLNDQRIFVGYEDGSVATIDVESEERAVKIGHNGRVKAAQYYQNFIVTASSMGEIKVWSDTLKELSSISTGCRITCLIIADWMAKAIKEEPEDNVSSDTTMRHNPVKCTVVVEVEESADETEEEKVVKVDKKKKKREKLENVGGAEKMVKKLSRKTFVEKRKKNKKRKKVGNEK